MNKFKLNLKNLLFFAAILTAFASLPRQTSAQSSSNDDSKSVTVKRSVLNDCSKALDELAIYDKLLEAKETEIRLLNDRLRTEKEKFDLVSELATARKNQAEANGQAIISLKEAIAAKDAQLAGKDKEIAILKKKKTSILSIIKTIAVGVSIGIVLK